VSEGEPGPPRPAPLRGTARALALAWLLAVVAGYVAVHVFGIELVR
jgi:hypothetical protein